MRTSFYLPTRCICLRIADDDKDLSKSALGEFSFIASCDDAQLHEGQDEEFSEFSFSLQDKDPENEIHLTFSINNEQIILLRNAIDAHIEIRKKIDKQNEANARANA